MSAATIARQNEPPAHWEVFSKQSGFFYHEPRWITSLAECFGFRTDYLTATQDGALAGVLALAEIPPLIGPRRLVSLPFSYASGPVAHSDAVAHALVTAAQELARKRGIRRVEIKQVGSDRPPAPGFVRRVRYSTYRIATNAGERAVWERLHASSTRRSIKRAQAEGVEVVIGEAERDWQLMAQLEEQAAHHHGLPAPPRRFFLHTCRALQRSELAELYLARLRDGRTAAGIIVWKGARQWIYAFGAADPKLLRYRPNHALLWTALTQAIAAGVGFDLGRAAPEQTGLVEFKMRWGAQPVPLAYDYWPAAGGLNISPRDRGRLAWAARLWSLLPGPVVRLGSGLYRYLG